MTLIRHDKAEEQVGQQSGEGRGVEETGRDRQCALRASRPTTVIALDKKDLSVIRGTQRDQRQRKTAGHRQIKEVRVNRQGKEKKKKKKTVVSLSATQWLHSSNCMKTPFSIIGAYLHYDLGEIYK